MKKKMGLAVAVLLAVAVALSITAHGAEVSSRDGGTTISITDITPRDVADEDKTENKADVRGQHI